MKNSQKERRRAPRLKCNERLAIRPLAQVPDAYITTIYCSTVDISPGGLQVKLDYTLPVGHVLDLSIKLERAQRRFKLAGEIRWANTLTAGETYLLGLLLRERDSADIKRWRRLFTKSRLPAYRPGHATLYSEIPGV